VAESRLTNRKTPPVLLHSPVGKTYRDDSQYCNVFLQGNDPEIARYMQFYRLRLKIVATKIALDISQYLPTPLPPHK